jgi:hypothetical protein
LEDDKLLLIMHAHPNLDIAKVLLAVRAVPGNGLLGRLQLGDRITWSETRDQRREGVLSVELPDAQAALVMLMMGPDTVRRHWFVDPNRAANHRLVAVQQFDRDLRMLRRGLFEATDASRFEQAVAALLFILGFAPSIQLETDAPDLIVATPTGRLAIIECTTRVADLMSKVGKLVDRRGALVKALQASNHPTELLAALVCRLPKDQIMAHTEVSHAAGVVLVAAEDLNVALDQGRYQTNPDLIFDQARQGTISNSAST